MASGKRWTAEEESLLRSLYPTHGPRYVSQKLGRSREKVRLKARKLGVRMDPESYMQLLSSSGSYYSQKQHQQPMSLEQRAKLSRAMLGRKREPASIERHKQTRRQTAIAKATLSLSKIQGNQ